MIEVDNDVTEQKHAEEALRRGEARYRALVAAAAQIVWTASADGRRPIDTSQWEAFTGQTGSEATWGGWFEAIHPDDRAEAIRAWSEAVASRQPLATEHRLRRRDGEYRSMEVRAVPVLDDHGRIREWVGAHTDITDRVHAEEQLSQAQRLQAVGTLAGGVAHEVNNQLMAVLGFGDFVLGALGQGHPQAADVREMVGAATRAARVAQQLLTFSRRQVKQTQLLDPARRDHRPGAGAGAAARRRQDPGDASPTGRAAGCSPTPPRSTRSSSTSPPTPATRCAPAGASPSAPTTCCWTRSTPRPTGWATWRPAPTSASPCPTPARG